MKKRIFLLTLFLSLCTAGAQLSANEIHLDLTGSSYATSGQENLKIYHLRAEGVQGKYTVGFRWNPATLSFMPVTLEAEQGYIVLSPQETASFINQGGDYVLLDVRSEEEYEKGHILTSRNYPTDKAIRDFPEDVKTRIQADIPDKNKMVIAYCGGLGCGRSGWAAESLLNMGYTNVFRFKGGYTGWCEAGYYFIITGTDLKNLIDSGDPDYTLVDVREASEVADGYIPTAINVPLSRIRAATSQADLLDLLPAQDGSCGDWEKPIIIYCAGLGTRYDEAAKKLAELGYIRLVTFPGGITEWNSLEPTYKYKTDEELLSMLKQEEPVHIVDIQIEAEYQEGHIRNSIATYAYPVKTDEERARLAAVLSTLQADEVPVVIVCPRGGGGAERAYDYLKEQGVAESRLFILKNGWGGWASYLEWTATGI